MFKRLLSDCSDIYCNEVFWTDHFPPTHETHEAPFRPIAVCVQAQQKHRKRNTHSFAHLEKKKEKKKVHLSEFSSSTFLLLSIPYNHTSWQAKFWNSTLTQDWFSGLSSFLSIVLGQFVTKLYSRLPALFPPAVHKALSYLLFFLHSIQMTAQALT